MEDLLNEDAPPEPRIKSIAVKLPFDLQERFCAFPFLHALRSLYPKADLHLITPKLQIEVLNMLPFEAYYHEFDEDEIQTILDVHRFCVNSKIFKVDLFVSLTDSFADACLGIGFRAQERLGFSDAMKSWVLNQKAPRPTGHHLAEDFLSLIPVHIGSAEEFKQKVSSRDLPSVIENANELPYIAINLSPLRGALIEEEWKELCDQFIGERIVFFASTDMEKILLQVQEFMDNLQGSNSYEFFKHLSWIDLGKMLAHAKGVITYNGPAASLSAYVGTKTLILFDQEDPKRTAPFLFEGEINILQNTDPAVNNVQETQGKSIKPRVKFSVDQIFQRVGIFFGV